MSDDTIKRLREAIAARPTPGPWKIRAERYKFIHVYATGGGICHLDTVDGEGAANAKLIAAASPDNIAALLDRLDAAERERDSKAAELANLQVAFSDWKVFHSTARLEAENERLRMEIGGLRSQLLGFRVETGEGSFTQNLSAAIHASEAIDAARREK